MTPKQEPTAPKSRFTPNATQQKDLDNLPDDFVAVVIEKRERDPDTGELVSKPILYMTDKRSWSTFYSNRASQGYKVNEVLAGVEGVKRDPDKGWN